MRIANKLTTWEGEARRAAFPPGSAHSICGSQQMYSKSRDDRRIYKLGSLPLPRAWGKFGQAQATIDVNRKLSRRSLPCSDVELACRSRARSVTL